ncbi:MAG: hypothetical protein ACI8UZ_002658 [Akkermansiaceae bacterium]|jgi:hypothetical protein
MGGSDFPETRWTLIQRTRREDGAGLDERDQEGEVTIRRFSVELGIEIIWSLANMGCAAGA